MDPKLNSLVVMQEIDIAARPLVDKLRKYFNPHTQIIITQTSIEVLSGELFIPLKFEEET